MDETRRNRIHLSTIFSFLWLTKRCSKLICICLVWKELVLVSLVRRLDNGVESPRILMELLRRLGQRVSATVITHLKLLWTLALKGLLYELRLLNIYTL